VAGIAAVESAQLLAGVSLPELTIAISPTFDHFREDDGLFHGAYGVRTNRFNQFPKMIERLRVDPDSRQCVTTIWQADQDMMDGKRDYPCTLLYHFMIRKDKLVMETVMRSNDVYLGLAYDGFQHSRVQIAVASVLGVEPGEYRHHAMSLHLYERDIPKVHELTMAQRKPDFFPALGGSSWDEIQYKADAVLRAANAFRTDGLWRSFDDINMDWYSGSMMKAIEKNRNDT
jgi:thymidylate synthase